MGTSSNLSTGPTTDYYQETVSNLQARVCFSPWSVVDPNVPTGTGKYF